MFKRDTNEFFHQHLTHPSVTAKERVVHGMQQLTLALQEFPFSNYSDQLEAIQDLQNALGQWSREMTIKAQDPPLPQVTTIKDRWDERLSPTAQQPAPGVRQPSPRVETPSPRVKALPSLVIPPALPRVQLPVETDTQPVAARTRSCQTPSPPSRTTSPDGLVAHRTCSRNICTL